MEGSIKITVTSKKLKAVALAKWVIRKSFEKVVEEKDPSLALLSDDKQNISSNLGKHYADRASKKPRSAQLSDDNT